MEFPVLCCSAKPVLSGKRSKKQHLLLCVSKPNKSETWKVSGTGCIGYAKTGQKADNGRHLALNVKLDPGSPLASHQPTSL